MNNSKPLRISILLGIAVAIVAAIFLGIFFSGFDKEKEIKVGFVLTGSKDEIGWNGMHYEAVKKACEELDMKLLVKEKIPEGTGSCHKAVEELISEGVNVIILSSYNYSNEVEDLIVKNENVAFYTNSADRMQYSNVSSYFVRMYQARYLSGIVAGMTTKSNKIGYVAAIDNSEVNRGIDAFALGVQRVNKDAEVIVNYTGAWDNSKAEYKATEDLFNDEGIDIVTYHQNRGFVAEKADELGIYSIGYHFIPENVSENFLTAVVCNWDTTYKNLLKLYKQGNFRKTSFYWLGYNDGVIDITEFSSKVPQGVKGEVEKARKELMDGMEIFSGDIIDNNGEVRCHSGEMISDDNLFENTDWLVKGVRIYEK